MNTYAITILNQTFIGDQPEPFFDVVTFLAELSENQTQDIVYLKKLATETQLMPNYDDGSGQMVTEKVAKILDVYELIDEVQFEGNPEVNSRQIVPAKPMDLDQFLATFYSDYVYEDDFKD